MGDITSMQCYISQLRHRLFLNFDKVLQPQTPEMKESEYFPDDLYEYLDDEVLVDCGAYSGDTISRFMKRRGNNFSYIYAFEPDLVNVANLNEFIKTHES